MIMSLFSFIPNVFLEIFWAFGFGGRGVRALPPYLKIMTM